jgi:hypothetical protein
MSLPAPLAAAHQERAVKMSYCLELKLPGYDLRLTDGPFYTFESEPGSPQTFTSKDAIFGTLGGVGQITDGVSEGFPTTEVVILPPSNTAVAMLSAPAAQKSQARIWQVTLDKITDQVIGVRRRFKGWADVPSYSVDEGTKTLSIKLNSVLAAVRQADEGARLNDGSHQQAWPGEKGLEFSSMIEQVDYWGSDTPSAAADNAAAMRRMLAGLGVNIR